MEGGDYMVVSTQLIRFNKVITFAVAALMTVGFLFSGVNNASAASCKVSADCTAGNSCQSGKCVKDAFGLIDVNAGVGGTLGNNDIRQTIGNIINVALSLLGVVAVVIILSGGFKWMTAGGSEEKVAEARRLIFQGIIGLAIILSAWAISLFVINALSSATGSGSGSVPTF